MGRLLFFSAALFISSTPAPQDVHSVVRALERRYQHASTLRAVFFERYSDGNGGVAAESGTVYFSRPGRMRWEYESPESKLFLVDGTNVWFYVPADRTASRAKLKESSDWRTPVALLAGKADLAQMCSHIELVNSTAAAVDKSNETTAAPGTKPNDRPAGDAPAAGDSMLRCAPRGSSDKSADAIREILFEVDSNSDLVRVVIRQPGNAETEFRFGAWQLNIPIAEAKFHFEAPAGVAIVDEATLAGALR
jgi:outer membrane lipoprotein-sorting protein